MRIPARLHVIFARESRRAIVIRRGPSKRVCTIGWDRSNDSFELGQWFKGRVYHYRCDLSPNGKYFIYFAMTGRVPDSLGGSWTAISYAPFLTAVRIYAWGDCWNGGGVFQDDTRYWVNSYPKIDNATLSVDDRLKQVSDPPIPVKAGLAECPTIYLPKLVRDGWRLREEKHAPHVMVSVFEKDVGHGWVLEKSFYLKVGGGPYGQSYFETYRLLHKKLGDRDCGFEWADWDADRVVFTEAGKLFSLKVTNLGPQDPVLLNDFNDMEFQTSEAPYEGVKRVQTL